MKEGKSSNSSSSQLVEKAGLPRHLCLDSQHSHHLPIPSFRAWALKFVPCGLGLKAMPLRANVDWLLELDFLRCDDGIAGT